MMGFFDSIMTPLYGAISFLLMYAYQGWSWLLGEDRGLTWAVSIMTITVVVRTLLIPLFVRQINSARNMQVIQPKIKELQDKYGADRQRLGVETQKLFKEEGVNPMASCFPMLLQMPIFLALYRVLYNAASGKPMGYFFTHNPDLVASLQRAKFMGAELAGHFWISDWSQFGATQILAIVLVVLMSGMMFVTQKQLMGKNMPPSAMTGPMAKQQKMMVYLFPVVYLVTGAIIPVGVLVYWVVNNLWTLTQQWIVIRSNPTPDTPAYIEWEERMIKKGLDPDKIAEERRAKRSSRPQQSTGSRKVGEYNTYPRKPVDKLVDPTKPGRGQVDQASRTTDNKEGTSGTTDNAGSSGIQRQQIQRQQPTHQSRSSRSGPKKPKKK